MAAATPSQRHYTLEDYLSVEEMSSVRHEFLDGQIFAMAGGTPEHAALSAAVLVLLGARLRGGPCRAYSADLRIRVAATGLATYADASVVCGEPERDPSSPTHVTNPTVVVEVLSPRTEEYDRGDKRSHYEKIDSLREYVLVAQDVQRVEIYARAASGDWEHRVFGNGDTVEIPSIALRFAVDELYEIAGLERP